MKKLLTTYWKPIAAGVASVALLLVGIWVGGISDTPNTTEESTDTPEITDLLIEISTLSKRNATTQGMAERFVAFYDLDARLNSAITNVNAFDEGLISSDQEIALNPPGQNEFIASSRDLLGPELTEELFDLELKSYVILDELWNTGNNVARGTMLACKDSNIDIYFAQALCTLNVIYKDLGVIP